MYIIEDGKAYLVEGEVGYLANFDTTGKMLIDKEKTIEAEGKPLYTYSEMYAKLNIAYKIQKAINEKSMKNFENEFIEQLQAKIAELEGKNKELNEQLEVKSTAEPKEKETEEEKTEEKVEETPVEEEKAVEEKKETKVETNKKEKK